MMKTQVTESQIDLLPPELRTEARWVVARVEDREGGKPTKIPYCPHAPARKASTTNPSMWSDFATAARLVREETFPALGFVLGDGFVGVDLDGCRDATSGVIEPWAQEIVDRLNSYTEVSVSGTGIHVICQGALPPGRRRKGSVEMYDHARYFVMTGQPLGAMRVMDRTSELAALHLDIFGEVAEGDSVGTLTTDDDLVRVLSENPVCRGLWSGDVSGYRSRSEADLALCRQVAVYTDGDAGRIDSLFRRSGLYRPKWDRTTYREPTIQKALVGFPVAGGRPDSPTAGATTTKTAPPGPSQATKIVDLTIKNGADLFHDADGDEYATVIVGGHRETIALHSRACEQGLAHDYFRVTKSVPTASAVRDAQNVLAAKARQGEERSVFVRLARQGNTVWLDLGNADWQVVKVTATGWEIVSMPDVRFRRPGGLMALPTPVRGQARLADLLQTVINVHEQADLQLIMGWLVGAMRGEKPYPILSVAGEHGSAKTSACRIIRRVIDPNTSDLRCTPKEPRDLMIMAKNAHILAFDNLSYIPDWCSDAFCTLATGGGFSTRQLFSNYEECLFSAARPIIVSGITEIITRPDLLDRALIVTLAPISDDKRLYESDLEDEFRNLHPLMLGALLDAVSMALKHEATTTLDRPPRLADFARWVTAAEPALHQPSGTFLAAYRDNRQTATENSMDGDLLVDTIRGLTLPWKGQVKDLYAEIPFSEHKPKSARAVGNALRRLVPALRLSGIFVEFTRTHGQRRIEITRTAETVEPVALPMSQVHMNTNVRPFLRIERPPLYPWEMDPDEGPDDDGQRPADVVAFQMEAAAAA